jgi:hypothetical protein
MGSKSSATSTKRGGVFVGELGRSPWTGDALKRRQTGRTNAIGEETPPKLLRSSKEFRSLLDSEARSERRKRLGRKKRERGNAFAETDTNESVSRATGPRRTMDQVNSSNNLLYHL